MSMTVQPPPVETPDAGVIEEARARQRRQRRVGGAATIAAAAIAAILLAFTVGGGGSRPAGAAGQHGGPRSQAARVSLDACTSPTRTKALERPPSRSLLSILAVLRRPATAATKPTAAVEKQMLTGGATRAVFVRYIRRARVFAGSPYYIYPALVGGCGIEKEHEGIMQIATHVDLGHGLYGGSGGGGATAAEIKRGGTLTSEGSSRRALVSGVVPDGVASVTFYYKAGPSSGFSHTVLPAVAIKARVVNNVVVARVPRGASNALRVKMIWRSVNGKIVKTIPIPVEHG